MLNYLDWKYTLKIQDIDLKRKITLFGAIFFALGSTLGTGIVATYGSVLVTTGSILISLIGWIIAGLLVIPQMIIQSEMVSAFPQAGGPYIFFKKAELKSVSFMYGWCYGIWGWPFSIAFRAYLTSLFFDLLLRNVMNIDYSFFNPWILRFFAFITIIIFGLISYFSVKWGTIVNNILTILKLLLFILFICIVFSKFNSSNFNIEITNILVGDDLNKVEIWFKGITFSIGLSIWSYNGINTVSYMAGEIKNPQKNLPLAMILSSVIIITLYSLFVISVGGLLAASEAINLVNNGTSPDNLIFIAVKKLNIKFVVVMLMILIFILSLGSVFTAIKFSPRLLYAMAKDNLFFTSFGKISKKWGSPSIAIILNTLIAGLLVFIPFNTKFIVIYFSFGTGLMNFFITLVIIKLWKNKDYNPTYKIRWKIFVLFLSIIGCIFAACSAFYTSIIDIQKNWILILAPLCSLITMVSAFPIYYIWKKYYQKNAKDIIQKIEKSN